MGLLDFFRRKALTASPSVVEAFQERHLNPYPPLGGINNQNVTAAYQRGIDASYGWIYSTQPAVRSVIDFIARNTAQLGLKLFERVSDTERQRREDHPAAQTMAYPDGTTPGDAFIFRLVTDFLIWDNAYVLKFRPSVGKKLTLIRLLPSMVTVSGGRFSADAYTVWRHDGSYLTVPPQDMLHWFGYNPDDPLLGLSKLETLRQELATDRAVQAALVELAKSGLKGGYISRPLEAPEWAQEDAERFAEQWRAAKKSGDPILDEGMKFEEVGVSPKDAEIISSRRFTKSEVAGIYGLTLDANGNLPGSDEERRMVYADVLPPITQSLACQLDTDILRGEYSEDAFYFEFDLNEKLRGDLENRASAMTAAAGGPWITRNEIRAKENLPPIEGGDDLITPMNVTVGAGSPALPAPNVMPIQDPNKPPQDGSHRTPKALDGETKRLEVTNQPRRVADMSRQRRTIDKAGALMQRHYTRQRRSLVGKKAAADSERWNRELADELEAFAKAAIELEGGVYVSRFGGHDFDMRLVENYTRAMAEGAASAINSVTQKDIEDLGVDEAFKRAAGQRADVAATGIGARMTTFARREAARQSPSTERRMQTWIANSERHADLDGATVPLGSDWGGISPGSEPNCACSCSIA